MFLIRKQISISMSLHRRKLPRFLCNHPDFFSQPSISKSDRPHTSTGVWFSKFFNANSAFGTPPFMFLDVVTVKPPRRDAKKAQLPPTPKQQWRTYHQTGYSTATAGNCQPNAFNFLR